MRAFEPGRTVMANGKHANIDYHHPRKDDDEITPKLTFLRPMIGPRAFARELTSGCRSRASRIIRKVS